VTHILDYLSKRIIHKQLQ